jgi:tripartite ATP-independent transporter DctM subunit
LPEKNQSMNMSLESAADRIVKSVTPVARILNAVGACTGLVMVLLVTVHVLSRTFFKKPLIGTVELEELMIVVLVFLGMAYTQLTRGHISVDFFTMRLPEGLRSVLSVFILMGELCFHAGLSEKLYAAAYSWVGRFRGGLSMATVLACGAFSAVSGSSLATAATLGAVSLPEMKRYKYADTLATGSIAAGGTIGILIPPSVVLIIYGILTEVSVAELFFAEIIPGLISILYYIIAIVIWMSTS